MTGCQPAVHFPADSLDVQAKAAGAHEAYDTDGKGSADFYMFTDATGRINRIGYDRANPSKHMEIVDLDRLPRKDFRHLVIILDGFGYDVVKKYYDQGGLRMFYPPSRVIAPYPTLTDLCLEDALTCTPSDGFEADYYNHEQNRETGGTADYLAGENEPYAKVLQYRASILWDAIAYLSPWAVYGKEINDAKLVFDKSKTQQTLMYFVSSAGVGTQQGAQGQMRCLKRVEQLVNQLYWETHGRINVTMFADHGHSYTPGTRIPLEDFLQKRGWRLVDKLQKPRDVAYIRFGLETYASFCTLSREELAADLIQAQGVELASYALKDTVVVLGKNGQKAMIRHKGDGYAHQVVKGDPLKFKNVLAGLTANKDGFYREEDLFRASLLHEYPSALQRLWRAHFSLVQDPADVIVSLEDKYYSGSRSFDAFVKVASTHGSLNRKNSTTFIMSTIAPLPEAMTSREIPANMREITGEKFPSGK